MKRILATLAVALLTVGVGEAKAQVATSGHDAAATVGQALMNMETQWAKASKAGDADALAPMLADDFLSLDSDGTMYGKSDVMARTKKATWVTNELSDMKVAVHGDSAVVTGSWTGNGTDGAGKAIDTKERWVDTWVKTASGKWQCVASAAATIK